MTNTSITISFLLIVAGIPAEAQILQSRPELCGRPGGAIPVPPGFIVDLSDPTKTVISVGTGSLQKRLELTGGADAVTEVCPLKDQSILVFEAIDVGAYDLILMNGATGALLFEDMAYDPAVSPDQHWLAYRVYHPPHSELPYTEVYMLYDLTKDAADNQMPGVDAAHVHAKGRLMYPFVRNNAPFEEYDLPREQLHRFPSDRFFWAPDSRSLIFADLVAAPKLPRGRLSLIWVRIANTGALAAYVHDVSEAEGCEGVRMNDAVITPREVGTEMWIEFDACVRPILLHDDDFKPAPMFRPPPSPKRKPASVQVKKQP